MRQQVFTYYRGVFRTYSKIYMKLFAKIVNGSKPLTIFAKSPIVDSDGVLNAPLLKYIECQRNNLHSLFSVNLSDKSKIVTLLPQLIYNPKG